MCQPPLTHSHHNGTRRTTNPNKQANPHIIHTTESPNVPPLSQPAKNVILWEQIARFGTTLWWY